MRNIAILGSTGSIGQNTLKVIRRDFPEKLHIISLSAHSNTEVLLQQINEFHPDFVCVTEEAAFLKLKNKLKTKTKLFFGRDGLREICRNKAIDGIVLAISGAGALIPLLEAIENKKHIALANKEALVVAGPIIMKKAKEKKVRIIPIDSEQSAIWQCLEGQNKDRLKRIYLTASGGPFLKLNKKQLQKITLKDALSHPRWKMGKKVTIDSANLMNKGLELIEAANLFCVSPEKIKVLIHTEAIIHSMVEFVDGVVMAQLSITDMRIPIQYALLYPERLPNTLPAIDFYKLERLSFQKPKLDKFPCLKLAYQAAGQSGTMPCVLNAANEISVGGFINRKIKFFQIPEVIAQVMDMHNSIANPGIEQILTIDEWARTQAKKVIEKLN
jgi:1-deoxy-D-xylulose-5-phosphate reductoisomerase